MFTNYNKHKMSKLLLNIDFDNKTISINNKLVYNKTEQPKPSPQNDQLIIPPQQIKTNKSNDPSDKIQPEPHLEYNCMLNVNNIYENFKQYCNTSINNIEQSIDKTITNINDKIIDSCKTIGNVINTIKKY